MAHEKEAFLPVERRRVWCTFALGLPAEEGRRLAGCGSPAAGCMRPVTERFPPRPDPIENPVSFLPRFPDSVEPSVATWPAGSAKLGNRPRHFPPNGFHLRNWWTWPFTTVPAISASPIPTPNPWFGTKYFYDASAWQRNGAKECPGDQRLSQPRTLAELIPLIDGEIWT